MQGQLICKWRLDEKMLFFEGRLAAYIYASQCLLIHPWLAIENAQKKKVRPFNLEADDIWEADDT